MEEEGTPKNNRHGMGDIRKTESEPFVAFLHVPMPTALRLDFPPCFHSHCS
jgi:hypothetical protein